MNARWLHLITLDPRMYLHTLFFVRTIPCSFPLVSLHPSSSSAWRAPSAYRTPCITFHTPRHKHMGQRGPCPSFITCYKRFRLTTNSILAQIFFARSSISSLTAHPPRNRVPGLRWSMFPFYLTSLPAAGTQSSPFTLARIHIFQHASCQRQTVLIRSSARNVPNSRLPVNPVSRR